MAREIRRLTIGQLVCCSVLVAFANPAGCTVVLALPAESSSLPSHSAEAPTSVAHIYTLLHRHDQTAVTELKRLFLDASLDKLLKRQIAVAMLQRKQGDEPYFSYLAGPARRAVDSDMPFPFAFDKKGEVIQQPLSIEFMRWTVAHKVDYNAALAEALSEFPQIVLSLALARDPRGAEILERGIASPNLMVVHEAACGLARLGRTSAVPRIIAVADRLPRKVAVTVADALVLFDDAAAQKAVDRLIGDKKIVAALRAHAKQELAWNIGD